MPQDAYPTSAFDSAMSALSLFHPDANPAHMVSIINPVFPENVLHLFVFLISWKFPLGGFRAQMFTSLDKFVINRYFVFLDRYCCVY